MQRQSVNIYPVGDSPPPTIWGLEPARLHDLFWAARGVCVVRQGIPGPVDEDAELYLLTDPRTLVIFRLRGLLETLSWLRPDLMVVRLRSLREQRYREKVVTDERGRFVRFKRYYEGFESRLTRVALTQKAEVARLWRDAADVPSAWRGLRRAATRSQFENKTLSGRAYDTSVPAEASQFVRDLVRVWPEPRTVVPNLRKLGAGVWAYGDVTVAPDTELVGPLWVGAGRVLGEDCVLGPAVLWDDPSLRPAAGRLEWSEIEPTQQLKATRPQEKFWTRRVERRARFYRAGKRAFDIAFSLAVLLVVMPIFPLVMLAIWLEDGRPFFFGHRRETVGGRVFPCLKFRSMRRNAEAVKAQLQKENQADGPQFYIAKDPRLTRVGRLIRKLNIDELPQFINVLLGHMSVVGPRPSPRQENQFCPDWREARLSVRPGVTGLWQVKRTRRQGLDFQEWIRFDLEYVERAGWRLDLYIIWRTVWMIVRGTV
jgi:lipopolysaccharide/colanic/teichoic acid biosynthesis glycosyltransferase